MKKISKGYTKNKKQRAFTNKKSLSSYFAPISKFVLAVAILFLLAFIVNAGDVVVESGKVGIGIVAPVAVLEIKSKSDSPFGDSGIKLIDKDTTNAPVHIWQLYDTGVIDLSQAGTIKTQITTGTSYFNGGNVGIGTTTPTAKLHVIGTINVTDSSGARISTDNTGNVIIQIGG